MVTTSRDEPPSERPFSRFEPFTACIAGNIGTTEREREIEKEREGISHPAINFLHKEGQTLLIQAIKSASCDCSGCAVISIERNADVNHEDEVPCCLPCLFVCCYSFGVIAFPRLGLFRSFHLLCFGCFVLLLVCFLFVVAFISILFKF
jgi:hypothetical protein